MSRTHMRRNIVGQRRGRLERHPFFQSALVPMRVDPKAHLVVERFGGCHEKHLPAAAALIGHPNGAAALSRAYAADEKGDATARHDEWAVSDRSTIAAIASISTLSRTQSASMSIAWLGELDFVDGANASPFHT